jgi:hypothetical protein
MRPPCPPFSPCWCEVNPGHPRCTTPLPIFDAFYAIILVIAAVCVVFIKKKKC